MGFCDIGSGSSANIKMSSTFCEVKNLLWSYYLFIFLNANSSEHIMLKIYTILTLRKFNRVNYHSSHPNTPKIGSILELFSHFKLLVRTSYFYNVYAKYKSFWRTKRTINVLTVHHNIHFSYPPYYLTQLESK